MSLIGGITRMFILVVGVIMIVVGIPIAPTPIPFGLPMVIVGFLMVASVSPGLRKWIRVRRTRNPDLDKRIAGIKGKVPGFLRKLIDLTDPRNGD
jgi:membrane protein implicated in regulation of membrane protease activity